MLRTSRALCSISPFVQYVPANPTLPTPPANIPLCKATLPIGNSVSCQHGQSSRSAPLVYPICHIKAQIPSFRRHGIWKINEPTDAHSLFSLYISFLSRRTLPANSRDPHLKIPCKIHLPHVSIRGGEGTPEPHSFGPILSSLPQCGFPRTPHPHPVAHLFLNSPRLRSRYPHSPTCAPDS